MGLDEQSALLQQIARNAFRVLGLPADAPQKAILERADALQRAAKAGITRKPSEWNLEEFGPLKQDRASISDALGRLSNPKQRLAERLFWFVQYERDFADHPADMTAADRHDEAVFALASCFLTDSEVEDADGWGSALQMWAALLESEDFWTEFFDIESAGDFEPSASLEDLDELRIRSHQLAIGPIAELARDAASRSESDRCRRVIEIIRAAPFPPDMLSAAEEGVLGPYEDALVRTSKEITKDCWDDIRQDRASAEWNAKASSVAVDRWKQDVEPRYRNLMAMTGASTDCGLRVRQEYADFLKGLGNALTWADQWVEAERVLKLAFSCLPTDSPARERIESILLGVGREAAEHREKDVERRKQADIEGFERLCEGISTGLWKVLNPAETRPATAEIGACKEAYRQYQKTVLPWLSIIRAAHSEASPHTVRARTAAARCLVGIAERFRYCGDRCRALDLLAPAAELAPAGSEIALEVARQRAHLYREGSSRPTPEAAGEERQAADKSTSAHHAPAQSTPSGADSSRSVDGFLQFCNALLLKCRQDIEASHGHAGAIRAVFKAAYGEYKKNAEPWMNTILENCGNDHELAARVRDSAAKCLYFMAHEFACKDDFDATSALASEALTLAPRSGQLREDIKHQIARARKLNPEIDGLSGCRSNSARLQADCPAASHQTFKALVEEWRLPVLVAIGLAVLITVLSVSFNFDYKKDEAAMQSATASGDATVPPTPPGFQPAQTAPTEVLNQTAAPIVVLRPIVPEPPPVQVLTAVPVQEYATLTPPLVKRDPVSLPNGTSLIGPTAAEGLGQLQINNNSIQDAVVKLKTTSDRETVRFVYVRARQVLTIPKIPVGSYLLEFASGLDWDESNRSFRQDRAFAKFENPLLYSEDEVADGTMYSVHKVTLHGVPNGNARSDAISADDFANDSGVGAATRPGR